MRPHVLFIILSLVSGVTFCHAAAEQNERVASCSGIYPNAHELFAPLRADPRDLQTGPHYIMPVSKTPQAEADAGDYWGLYRWCLSDGDLGRLQVSGGGGVFGLFDYHDTKNLLADDFYGNLPIDYRLRKWSSRLMFTHMSSHLGDDTIHAGVHFPGTVEFNAMRGFLSYDVSDLLRLYNGGFYTIAEKGLGGLPWGAEGGLEMKTVPFWHDHLMVYWANDVQAYERTAWNPTLNSQLGVRTAHDLNSTRAVAYFIEFFSGHNPTGQFFQQEETRWNLGIKFELTQ
jgi:hypothetical protein